MRPVSFLGTIYSRKGEPFHEEVQWYETSTMTEIEDMIRTGLGLAGILR